MKNIEPDSIPPALTLSQDLAAKDEMSRAASHLAEDETPPGYDEKYYDALHDGAVHSAAAVVPFVQDIFAARRVVDLGCGTGAWLAAFQAHGATRILGVDLPPLDDEAPGSRAIPTADFLAWNLTNPLKIRKRFDLAVSLEVAEHLPVNAADTFLDSLVRLAPVVLFSAAIPDQGGEHHDNEQWPAWWATRFKERGYLAFDCLRAHFWDDLRVETWYAQNMLLFVRETDVERYPKLPKSGQEAAALPQALVHPRWWVFAQQQHRAVEERLREVETGRWEAETGRWEAETALNAAEDRMREIETGRQEAETGRREAETALTSAAERLREAEAGQWEAETALNATEERLREVETGQWEAETGRWKAETALHVAEKRLWNAETGRWKAETALHASEKRLREAETGLWKAETGQWKAETALSTAEKRLWEAETGRWKAETALSAMEERLREVEEARVQDENAASERLRATRQHLARSLVGGSPVGEGPRALIIIPGSLNYFYDQAGQRIAEALTNLGFHADVRTLREITDPVPMYDRTFVINIAETILAYGAQGETRHQTGLNPAEELLALARLADVRAAVGGPTAAVQLDCVETWWFTHACELCDYVGIPTLLDLGFHDQSADLTPAQARMYRFVFNGLTESERRTLDALDLRAPRPVPWVFVGHMTEDRMRLVRRIMSEVDLSGFVYMPTLAPFTASGPHLNEQQLTNVLGRARYQIWCAHHTYFYLESERFRQSVLAGAVPIKLLTTELPSDLFPFTDFVLDEATFAQQLRAMDFPAMQRRAIDEFRALPSLEEGMLALLALTGGAHMAWAGRREHAMGVLRGS